MISYGVILISASEGVISYHDDFTDLDYSKAYVVDVGLKVLGGGYCK